MTTTSNRAASYGRAPVRAPAREADRDRGSFQTITDALEQAVGPGRPSGAWTRYCCPAHEGDGKGHRPSLGVKYSANEGRTVVRCFAGCDNEQVLATIGLGVADMFDRRPERAGRGYTPPTRARKVTQADRAIDAAGLPLSRPKPDLGQQVSPWRQTAVYGYQREDGTAVGEVIRQEAKFDGGRDKRFHQRARTENGWADTGFAKVPFRLPAVLDAIAEGRTVYVCEGEKDVLAAESAGLVATTNAGGASSWTPEHAAWLRGAATVVILADRDAPGYRRAERVMDSLSGLVGRVRVLQAATGKDLHDHLQAGHEIGDLDPIPHLDPLTPTGPAPTAQSLAAETDPVSAAPSAHQKEEPMSLAYGASEHAPVHHDDTVDHVSQGWAAFSKLLMGYLIMAARRHLEAARAASEKRAAESEAERAAVEAEKAAEKAAVEARLQKLRTADLNKVSRDQIAKAVADAAAWSPDSEVAAKALVTLSTHVQGRFGVKVDPITGEVATEAPAPELAKVLAGAEADRATGERLQTAQDRMVSLVAAEAHLDESVKTTLYAEIERWRADPTTARLGELTKKLTDAKVGEQARGQIRFVASYLGTPGQEPASHELGDVRTVMATAELRKLDAPLVDLGEEAKPRVDKLLAAYQDRLKVGMSTTSVRERLDAELAVLTPEDEALARARGNAIRRDPAERFKPMWPDHVDRDELATTVRMYATLSEQSEITAVKANGLDDVTAAAMRKQAQAHETTITRAITHGKGLHQLERDQLTAILRDIDAGKKVVPELLFADDRSAAAVDTDRAVAIAHTAGHATRHKVEEILDTNTVGRGVARRTRDELSRVMDAQSALAAGRVSLGDYERTEVDWRYISRLAAAGVSEPLRGQVRAHLDLAAGQAASIGKQAHRIADAWDERRDAVAAARTPEKPGFDSPQRREEKEAGLAAAGLDADQIAQHMAASAGSATPLSRAVKNAPGKSGKSRSTAPGAGVRRAYNRGKGRGEPGLGR
ncbi:toprim domain-containing protein [Nocardia niigatensis]